MIGFRGTGAQWFSLCRGAVDGAVAAAGRVRLEGRSTVVRKIMPLWCALVLIIIVADAFAGAQAAGAGNLAAGRAYTLSQAPNYETAAANSETLLTDGHSAWRLLFWRNGTALGWTWRSPVAIEIDLDTEAGIDRVRIEALARGKGQAYFPSQMFVYGAASGSNFAYLGASTLQQDSDTPHDAALRTFEIRFAARQVQRIVVVVIGRGAFIFLSEIEALAADGGAPTRADGSLAGQKELVDDAAERRRNAITALPGSKPVGPQPARRWAMPLDPSHGAGSAGCSVTRIEPWSDVPGRETAVDRAAPLIAGPGGYDYAAFRIDNTSEADRTVTVSPASAGTHALRWQALAHVQALNYAWVADAVTPFSGTTLPSRNTMIVLAEIAPQSGGGGRVALEIGCGDVAERFDIPVRIVARAANQKSLHGTQWAYVHQPPQSHIASALICEPDILARFGIDTQVVHPDALIDNGTTRPDALLARYLNAFRDAPRILLGMDVKTRPWAFKATDDEEAARSLGAWFAWVRQHAQAAGAKGELIIYPIDEPRDEDDVALVLRTVDLLKAAGVTARSYATVNKEIARDLAPLDILQIHRPTPELTRALGSQELHSYGYGSIQEGRRLSVNGEYRMLGWRAYAMGLDGIGVWSAWDGSGLNDPATGWNPFVGFRERDFGLFYGGSDGCGWPSRRLIAWRRGIEENRILRACLGETSRRATRSVVDAAVENGNIASVRNAVEVVAAECE